MGKQFDKELEQLEDTYKWAIGVDVSEISWVIRNSCGLPLLSVGSGGSLSAAEFQALLHRTLFSSIGQAVTPLELISMLPRNREVAVWFMSANGGNIDISRAFKHTILHEMKSVSALVCRKESKLNKLSTEYQYTKCFQFPIPSGKDGFLATNSLLAFLVILYRAYSDAISEVNKTIGLSKTLNALFRKCLANFSSLKDIEKTAALLWNKKSIHVLYSPDLKPVALDIESKFTEAGLISSHLADIRNFAHGRHNWFSHYGTDSGVIALSTNNDYAVIEKTLGLLPKTVPKTHISFNYLSGVEVIVGIVLSMHLTDWLGNERDINPGQFAGRHGFPPFGSKIYGLTANPGFITSVKKKEAAIERKRKLAPLNYGNRNEQSWVNAYNRFTRRLAAANIGGVVLDYDGTVVDSDKRWNPPSENIADELIRLLEENVIIGFATGRGKSIRDDLQSKKDNLQHLIPDKFWGKILIGHYNGAELKCLSDNTALSTASDPIPELKLLFTKLENNIFLSSVADLDQKKCQLTVKLKKNKPLSETFLWDLVQDELHQYLEHEEQVFRSSHSVDIIARSVSKLHVVEAIKQNIQENSEILSIGDRGRWPGNDAELLKETLSLSVDEVSYSPKTCWNLCPAGIRGAQGTLYYLRRLKRRNGTVRFFP